MDIQKEREAFEDWFSCNAIRDHEYVRGERMDENGNYYSEYAYLAWSAWQAAKAQAVLEGFVLIKNDTKTVVAIERMVEQQVEASGMDSRRLERLDGWRIIEAAIEAQEQK